MPPKDKGYLTIRIPTSVNEDLSKLCEIENRSKVDMTAVMIQEYIQLKKRIARPFSVQREIKINGALLRFGPGGSPEDLSLTIVTENPLSVSTIPISTLDKEKVLDIISNLLLFSNSI